MSEIKIYLSTRSFSISVFKWLISAWYVTILISSTYDGREKSQGARWNYVAAPPTTIVAAAEITPQYLQTASQSGATLTKFKTNESCTKEIAATTADQMKLDVHLVDGIGDWCWKFRQISKPWIKCKNETKSKRNYRNSCSCSIAISMLIFSFWSSDKRFCKVFAMYSPSWSIRTTRSDFSFFRLEIFLRSLLVMSSSSCSWAACYPLSRIKALCGKPLRQPNFSVDHFLL